MASPPVRLRWHKPSAEGSKSWAKAQALGLQVATVREACEQADIIMVLLPDQVHREVYNASIAPALKAGKTLMFAHGFNIHFGQVVPPPAPSSWAWG